MQWALEEGGMDTKDTVVRGRESGARKDGKSLGVEERMMMGVMKMKRSGMRSVMRTVIGRGMILIGTATEKEVVMMDMCTRVIGLEAREEETSIPGWKIGREVESIGVGIISGPRARVPPDEGIPTIA